jgi:hypothetical protein
MAPMVVQQTMRSLIRALSVHEREFIRMCEDNIYMLNFLSSQMLMAAASEMSRIHVDGGVHNGQQYGVTTPIDDAADTDIVVARVTATMTSSREPMMVHSNSSNNDSGNSSRRLQMPVEQVMQQEASLGWTINRLGSGVGDAPVAVVSPSTLPVDDDAAAAATSVDTASLSKKKKNNKSSKKQQRSSHDVVEFDDCSEGQQPGKADTSETHDASLAPLSSDELGESVSEGQTSSKKKKKRLSFATELTEKREFDKFAAPAAVGRQPNLTN